jgi:hypothetical protein
MQVTPQPSSRSPRAKHRATQLQLASSFSALFLTFSREPQLILDLMRDFHRDFKLTDNVHPSASPLQRSNHRFDGQILVGQLVVLLETDPLSHFLSG